MRIKNFVAATVGDAMRQIRAELGDDAVIVSTQSSEHGEGVRVTAALDSREAENELADLFDNPQIPDVIERIRTALAFHGLPPSGSEVLLDHCHRSGAEDPTAALTDALKRQFRFAPLSLESIKRPLMLIGPPGAGKTIAVAKLATRAALAKHKVKVISADTFKAGALEQLAAFTDIIESNLDCVNTPEELARTIQNSPPDGIVLIDSSGTNPFSTSEMATLARFLASSSIEPVLVTPAGGDVEEAAEIAESFRAVGARRFILTRVDMTRRFGAALVAASAGPLSFSEVSISPHVARGLTGLNPNSLARLLLRDPYRTDAKGTTRKVAT